jgi:ribosome-associated heat shock protein Hsp15
MSADESSDDLRIDRWLWCTRFFKTRSAAAQAVRGGHVRLNGQRPKPSRVVALGDRITVCRDFDDYEIIVTRIPSRRGPAAEALTCYTESETSMRARALREEQRRAAAALTRPPTLGRPDKRTRRLIRAHRGG